jgi:hypothetical protein
MWRLLAVAGAAENKLPFVVSVFGPHSCPWVLRGTIKPGHMQTGDAFNGLNYCIRGLDQRYK